MGALRMRTALEAGEEVVGTWLAGLPTLGGRGVKYGGSLILTTQRLLWEPINLPGVLKLAPGLGMLDSLCRGVSLPRIVSVRPDPDRRALLHVDGLDGSLQFLVGASRLSPVWSRKNGPARDDAVAALQAALMRRRG